MAGTIHRGRWRTTAVVLALTVATACAGDRRPAGTGPAPLSTTASPPPTAVADQVPAFADPLRGVPSSAPPAKVAPTARPSTAGRARLLSVPWTLVALSEDGRRVTIRYRVAGCAELSHVVVRQTSRRVELGVHLADRRGLGQLCPAYATSARSAVLLERPLGARELVHVSSTR